MCMSENAGSGLDSTGADKSLAGNPKGEKCIRRRRLTCICGARPLSSGESHVAKWRVFNLCGNRADGIMPRGLSTEKLPRSRPRALRSRLVTLLQTRLWTFYSIDTGTSRLLNISYLSLYFAVVPRLRANTEFVFFSGHTG